MQKLNKIIVTDEMMSKIHTDSDIRDLAEEMGVSYRDLDYAVDNKLNEGTPCHNCQYASLNYMTYPCSGCKRIHTEDFYKEVEFKE